MLAILDAKRAGLLGRRHWASNIVAGLIVGVVALPLAMAFAIASGVKPEQGIYTSIIAGIIVALFGGSRIRFLPAIVGTAGQSHILTRLRDCLSHPLVVMIHGAVDGLYQSKSLCGR